MAHWALSEPITLFELPAWIITEREIQRVAFLRFYFYQYNLILTHISHVISRKIYFIIHIFVYAITKRILFFVPFPSS